MRIGDRKGRWLRGGRGLRHGVLASRQEGWPVRGSQDIRPRARSLEGPGTIVEAQGRGPSCPCPGMESSGKQSGPCRGLEWSAHAERAARGALAAGASLKAPLSAGKPRAAPGDSVGSPVASQHRRSDARGAESSAGRGQYQPSQETDQFLHLLNCNFLSCWTQQGRGQSLAPGTRRLSPLPEGPQRERPGSPHTPSRAGLAHHVSPSDDAQTDVRI